MSEELYQDFTDILADCLEEIKNGRLTIPDCLAAYPEHQAELQTYLQLTGLIQQAADIRPSPAFRQQARASLLAKLPPHPPAHVTVWQPLRHSWQNLMTRRKTQMTWIVLIVSAILLLVGGGTAYAADNAVPGDVLYGLDRSMESLHLSLATGPESAVNIQLNVAQERLEEAQQLLAAGQPVRAQEALSAYGLAVTQASKTIANARPDSMEVLTQRLEDKLVSDNALLQSFANYGLSEIDLETPEEGDDETPACHDDQIHPVGQSLADQYSVPYEEIMGWFCNGYGFGEIGIAYSLSQETNTAVDDIFDLRASGLGWGQIRALLANPEPGLTPTPVITPTATITATPPITPTATITATVPAPTSTPAPTDCTGANPHPQGTALANQYSVPYEEIMGWFCGGFGFGEINQAYNLSQETGTPVGDIFAMKASGLGWGQIRQALSGDDSPPGNSNGNQGGGNGHGNTNPGSGNPGQGNDNQGNGNNGNQGNGHSGNGNQGNGNNGNNGNGNNGNNGNGNGGSPPGKGNGNGNGNQGQGNGNH